MNKYLASYLIAVQHPDVSGFETLDMLLTRDKLAHQESELTTDQRTQLQQADEQFIKQASLFYRELAQITDMGYEREQRKPCPDQWWWYLDVLSSLPSIISSSIVDQWNNIVQLLEEKDDIIDVLEAELALATGEDERIEDSDEFLAELKARARGNAVPA